MRVLTAISVGVILSWLTPSLSLATDEDKGAVYNSKIWDCTVDGNRFEVRFSGSITIFSKQGKDYAVLSLAETAFSELKRIKARVTDANGNLLFKRDKKDFTKACGYGEVSLYADHCYYYLTLESSQYPYTIEYEYTLEVKSLFFLRTAQMQHYIPVKHARYTLSAPSDFRFRYRCYDMDSDPVEIDSSGDQKTYVWEVFDLPALEDIDYVPPDQNTPARLVFAAETFEFEDYQFDNLTWKSIGRWYNHLAADCYAMCRILREVPYTATPSPSTVEDILYHVTDNIRYVSISIGVGGWQPHPSLKTQELGYGDCKDMSTLLVSELRNRNIEAYPALVLTRSEGKLDTDFPNFGFNHVIAMSIIGNDTIWMDPTCDECPFGYLPSEVQDVDALVVMKQGGELRRTPGCDPTDNAVLRESNLVVLSDLQFDISSTMTVSGAYAVYLRSTIPDLTEDELQRFIRRRFSGADKKYKISSFDIANLDSLHLPIEISMRARGTKPLRKIGVTIYADPFLLNPLSDLEEVITVEREFDLNLYYPRLTTDHITITWDSTLSFDSVAIPVTDSAFFDNGKVVLQSSRQDSKVTLTTEKSYNSYEIGVTQLAAFEDFRDKMKKLKSQRVKFYRD